MPSESILPKLFAVFRSGGYEALTGHNPCHFSGFENAPFTRLVDKDGEVHGLFGLALQEILFMENLAYYIAPRNILVVGNALGWSTIALALIFPDARVLAIDPDQSGNQFTNTLATHHGLKITVEKGLSPQDVEPLCKRCLTGAPDLVLIDAVHEGPAMITDFTACCAVAHDRTFFVLHDLINWDLVGVFRQLCQEHGYEGHVLTRTPSGMGAAWKELSNEKLRDYVKAFADNPDLFRSYRNAMVTRVVDKIGRSIEKI